MTFDPVILKKVTFFSRSSIFLMCGALIPGSNKIQILSSVCIAKNQTFARLKKCRQDFCL